MSQTAESQYLSLLNRLDFFLKVIFLRFDILFQGIQFCNLNITVKFMKTVSNRSYEVKAYIYPFNFAYFKANTNDNI